MELKKIILAIFFVGFVSSANAEMIKPAENLSAYDVIYKDTGHVEALELTYDPNKVDYEKLLKIFWRNIDPFDSEGQFCDKGKSYRSVIFFQNQLEKEFIDKSFKNLELSLIHI